MVHSSQPSGEAPWLSHLVQLKIDNGVCEDECLGLFVEEDNFPENPARNCSLVDFSAPFLRRIRTKFLRELHIDAARTATRSRMWRGPGHSIRKRPRPLPDMRVVKLIGRYEMAHPTQRSQGFGERN